ncbi:transcription antiterminator [Lentibacillus cibarius]|uniref:Transcription antiterminator n=1 Tax=Lentibacillus cibarius TaxID=2583219 RepID=A0A549YF88_9BACI|nr:BglG family transcription antiterminator [Lentibacillus cibarius]TRM10551.1 transcription antiterminator [Lentibacillus cibarius]
MRFSGRERKVMDYLLRAEESVPVKVIADRLDVSERTIHRDLKNIESAVSDYNLVLDKQSGKGLRIIGEASRKQDLAAAIAGTAYVEFTPEERQTIILSALLEADEPVKLFTLAAELDVTTATVSHDLDQLEEEMAAYHLRLIRRRGYGIQVEGSEANIRAVISNLIARHVNPSEFVAFLKQHTQNHRSDTISERLLGLVNPEKLSIIEDQVQKVSSELRYELADSAYIGLVVHLSLAMERLQKGDTITFDQMYMEQISGTNEYAIARKLIRYLEQALNQTIPDDEIGYITMHLMGAKLRADQNYLMEDSSMDVAIQAKALIQHVSNRLHQDLTHNRSLLNDLIAHLKPSIYRLKQGLTIHNPMLDELKRDYEELFEIIQDAVNITFPDIQFPEDEVAYLVLHFASVLLYDEQKVSMRALVICSSGIGTAKMLATKLRKEVPEIKQVENISIFDLENRQTADYDVIVSTIPLNEMGHQYILTSPIPTNTELERIKRQIRKKRTTVFNPTAEQRTPEPKDKQSSRQQLELTQAYSGAILSVLDSLNVKRISGVESIEALLQLACQELAKQDVLENYQGVKQALLERQAKRGLGVPGTHLALYHARSDEVKRPSFTVYSLGQPLTIECMDESYMNMKTLLLMLAPSDTNQEVLETLSYLSSLMIEEEGIRLFESGDADQLEQYLSKQFYKWLQEKME